MQRVQYFRRKWIPLKLAFLFSALDEQIYPSIMITSYQVEVISYQKDISVGEYFIEFSLQVIC